MVRVAVEPGRIFRLRPADLHDLNRIALEAVHESAGSTRSEDVCIGGSKHTPPVWQEVPRLVDEFCDYINEKWKENSAIFLSSYAMWKVNWIHPYLDGNGRTSRAISYYILCAKLGFLLPGENTIPDLIAQNKFPYYDALEVADAPSSSTSTPISTWSSKVSLSGHSRNLLRPPHRLLGTWPSRSIMRIQGERHRRAHASRPLNCPTSADGKHFSAGSGKSPESEWVR